MINNTLLLSIVVDQKNLGPNINNKFFKYFSCFFFVEDLKFSSRFLVDFLQINALKKFTSLTIIPKSKVHFHKQ